MLSTESSKNWASSYCTGQPSLIQKFFISFEKEKNFQLIVGSVLNKSLIKRLIKNQNFIIPLAGLVGAPLCDKFPKLARSVNLNSVTFMRKCLKKNQKVIFATTNSGYGIGKKNKFCTEKI